LLIAEVLSKHDLTDKFILYQKISSLQYYLATEPEKHVVLFYEKMEDDELMAKTFTSLDETIPLAALDSTISLKEIYAM
jgi:Uma2 family endonuclease